MLDKLLKFEKYSIRKKFIIYSAIVLVAVLLVQMQYYLRITSTTKKMVDDYTNTIVAQGVSSIDKMMTGAQQVAYHFSYGSLIEDYLQPEDNYQLYSMWDYQKNMVRTAVETNPNIFDIAFFRTDGYIRYQFRNSDLEMRSTLDKYESILLEDDISAHFICMIGSKGLDVRIPAYVQPIYHTSSPANMGKLIGVCVVMLHPDMLSEVFVDIPTNDNSAFFLIDTVGTVVSSTEENHSDVSLLMEKSTVITHEIGSTGWKLVCDVDTQSAVANYRFFSSFALTIAILMFLFIIFLLQTFNQNIVSPIYKLHKEIETVISRNFRNRINMPYNNEIGSIAKAINMMIDRQSHTTNQMLVTQQRLYEAQLEVTQNELLALENQVNPHFLLNTLQCICGIAVETNSPMIVDITSNLAEIFNYSLRAQDEVTLGDELRCIRQYLSIIDIRFDNAIKWEADFTPELLDQKIAKMVLQPLVENAVYHGLERKGSGHLSIRALHENEIIKIIIQDDGVGISPDKLSEIHEVLSDKDLMHQESIQHKRIGLANTCWRLKMMFDDNYGITLSSTPGSGTITEITIPYSL